MKMKPVIWNLVGRLTALSGLVLAVTLSLTPAQASDDSSESGKLEGTWFTQASIRDCTTGAVLRTFSALNTFASGGTLTDTTAAVSPALRSPGLGTWEKTYGQMYSATSLAFLFNPAGAWTGTQRLTHSIRFNGDAIEFTSTNEIFNTSGTVTTTGCATAVGHRL
jgi:hypothetical protein